MLWLPSRRIQQVAALYPPAGGGGGGGAATWNPSDTASQIDTFTNGNRTIAKSGDSSNWRSVRTTPSFNGKVIFRLTFDAGANLNGFLFGPSTSGSAILNSYPGSVAGSVGHQSNFGTPYGGWTINGSLPSISVGDDIEIAIDKPNAKWWMREVTGSVIGDWNGNNGSHDPATNTGGHTISDATLTGASDWYFAMSLYVPGNQVTLQSTLLGTAPSGFSVY